MDVLPLGAALGIGLGSSFGPGVLRLVDLSLQGEVRRAIAVAVGLLATDVFYLAFAAFAVASLSPALFESQRMVLSWVAGAILVAFGATGWREQKKEAGPAVALEPGGSAVLRDGLAGFVLNLFNPFIPAFWFGSLSYLAVQHPEPMRESRLATLGVFAVASLGTVFLTDLAKVWIFARAGRALRNRGLDRAITMLRRGASALIALTGLWMIWQAYRPPAGGAP
jgi:threonine/homoserine/homoserine lactone efflux protein